MIGGALTELVGFQWASFYLGASVAPRACIHIYTPVDGPIDGTHTFPHV